MYTISEPQRITVQSDFDVVNLRHTVRQIARAVGMDLTRQAKVTVAISAMARAFIGDKGDLLFTVRVIQSEQKMLEISCVSSETHQARSPEHLERQLNLQEIRLLVDEFIVRVSDISAQLTIRMALST